MPEVVLVKLGGSLITDKQSPDTLRRDLLGRLAQEIARVGREGGERLVLGHGAGSFGHVAAAKYGLNRGRIEPRQLPGVSLTQERAASLHRAVIDSLLAAGALPFSLAPSSFLTAAAGRPRAARLEPLRRALGLGLLPVVFGDVVLDRRWGASICSTETLFLTFVGPLRRAGWRVGRAFWLGETEGVYDPQGATIARIRRSEIDSLLSTARPPRGTDVTGGMVHRLTTAGQLAALGLTSWILDGRAPGRLQKALAGEEVPGTLVVP